MLCFQDCVYREYMFWENKKIPQEEAFNGILTFCFNIFGEVNAIRKNNCRKKKMFQSKFGISTNEGEKMFILNTVVFFCVSYLISFFFFSNFDFYRGKKTSDPPGHQKPHEIPKRRLVQSCFFGLSVSLLFYSGNQTKCYAMDLIWWRVGKLLSVTEMSPHIWNI